MRTHPWRESEITLISEQDYPNPYTDVEVRAEFTASDGTMLRRPAFWDGGRTWKVRFAAPVAGRWTWRSFGSVDEAGLVDQSGEIVCETGPSTEHRFYRHGFWRMSPGGRNLIHADGTDGAARRRYRLGIALARYRGTMPSLRCRPPGQGLQRRLADECAARHARARTTRSHRADEGFDIGFEDLSDGSYQPP